MARHRKRRKRKKSTKERKKIITKKKFHEDIHFMYGDVEPISYPYNFSGVPAEFADKEMQTVENASVSKVNKTDYVTVKRITTFLGAK